MKDIQEILMVNGIAVLMMVFLLSTRRNNRESLHREDKLYDSMAIITILGAILETIGYLVDGVSMSGGIVINYICNTLVFLGTVSIALLWCAYVDLRVYRNYTRTKQKFKYLFIPWILESVVLIINLFGTNLLFHITEENIYVRDRYMIMVYIILVLYYAYSVYLVKHSKTIGLKLQFFPINYFIAPCLIGTVVQLFSTGITASWVSVAIALTFVQMQSHSENLLIDSLSGLFNRRYLNSLLSIVKYDMQNSFYGIMIDVNDFKDINDNFGHAKGDEAIRVLGDVLSSSVPDGAMAIRYAGDEFMVLLPGAMEGTVLDTMKDINKNLEIFNNSGKEEFHLSVSMGYSRLEESDNGTEPFLSRMDEGMYEAKRQYHLQEGKDRRRN